MKTSEHAKTTAVISSMTVCVNIILNAIFIFGGFGIAPMGVRGAALATLIARIIELCCSVLISYKPNYLHPSMHDLLRRNKQLSKDFWKCGLPLLGACLFWGIGFTSYSSFMGHLGTDAAAANSVAAVVRDIICCFSAGISSAAGIMIGNELGAGNLEKGKRYGIRLLKISFAMRYFCFSFNVHICTNYFALCKAYTAGTGVFKGHVCRYSILYDRTCRQRCYNKWYFRRRR
mgnify:CR=1 FL=1